MEVACPGTPGSAVGQQKELAKAKEKTQSLGKKQSCIFKLEAVEKSPVFCGKWEILNDVITKGTAKDGSEGGPPAISIIAQAECKDLGLLWIQWQMSGLTDGWLGTRGQPGSPHGEQGQSDCSRSISQTQLRV